MKSFPWIESLVVAANVGIVWAIIFTAEKEKTERAAHVVDQCMRADLFQRCIKDVLAGPRSVVANDWEEVVSACASSAYEHSRRGVQFVKPECRP